MKSTEGIMMECWEAEKPHELQMLITLNPDKVHIVWCMKEWAKIEACRFAQWCSTEEYLYDKGQNLWYDGQEEDEVTYTPERLYQIYVDSKTTEK